jgi:hypothetical protein
MHVRSWFLEFATALTTLSPRWPRGSVLGSTCAALLSLSAVVAHAQPEPPPVLASPVTDLALVLSEPTRAELDDLLRAHRDAGRAQIAVLTVQTTAGEAIADYALRVATAAKLGRAGADDGALFVLAVRDRRMRVEVGYGLEENLSDGVTKQILEAAKPQLGAGGLQRSRVRGRAKPRATDAGEPKLDGASRRGAVTGSDAPRRRRVRVDRAPTRRAALRGLLRARVARRALGSQARGRSA